MSQFIINYLINFFISWRYSASQVGSAWYEGMYICIALYWMKLFVAVGWSWTGSDSWRLKQWRTAVLASSCENIKFQLGVWHRQLVPELKSHAPCVPLVWLWDYKLVTVPKSNIEGCFSNLFLCCVSPWSRSLIWCNPICFGFVLRDWWFNSKDRCMIITLFGYGAPRGPFTSYIERCGLHPLYVL